MLLCIWSMASVNDWMARSARLCCEAASALGRISGSSDVVGTGQLYMYFDDLAK